MIEENAIAYYRGLTRALGGQADVIVSGDHRLLDLGVFRDIPIITARQFLDQLKQE